MAASSVVDSVTADQLKRAYDLGHQEGLNCAVQGHASNHTVRLDLRIAHLENCIASLNRECRRLRASNKLLRIVAAVSAIVAAYSLMAWWAA